LSRRSCICIRLGFRCCGCGSCIGIRFGFSSRYRRCLSIATITKVSAITKVATAITKVAATFLIQERFLLGQQSSSTPTEGENIGVGI